MKKLFLAALAALLVCSGSASAQTCRKTEFIVYAYGQAFVLENLASWQNEAATTYYTPPTYGPNYCGTPNGVEYPLTINVGVDYNYGAINHDWSRVKYLVVDEPFWDYVNNVIYPDWADKYARLMSQLQDQKISHPGLKVILNYSEPEVNLWAQVQPTPNMAGTLMPDGSPVVDVIGMDVYYKSFGGGVPSCSFSWNQLSLDALYGYINGLSYPSQKLHLTPPAFWQNSGTGCKGPTSEGEAINRLANFMSWADTHPRVTVIMPWLWPTGGTNPTYHGLNELAAYKYRLSDYVLLPPCAGYTDPRSCPGMPHYPAPPPCYGYLYSCCGGEVCTNTPCNQIICR